VVGRGERVEFMCTLDTRVVETKRSGWYTGHFIIFSVITNIYNKKTTGPTLMELFTATGKQIFFLTTRDVRCTQVDVYVTRT
jgi:hypothetical protein